MKKQLLNEGEIRKFMKFANIGTLTDGFVGKINESAALEEDTLEEAEDALEEMVTYEDGHTEKTEEALDLEEAGHEGDEEPEMGDEPEMDAEPEMDDEEEVEVDVDMDEVGALEKAIEVLQQVVDAAKGGADMGDEPMGMDDEPMGDMAAEEEGDDGLEEVLDALEEVETLDEEEVIEEVTRRVAKRLLAARR